MRKLAIKDAFALARILKKADIEAEIAEFANKVKDKKNKGTAENTKIIGIEFVLTILSALSDKEVEQEFYLLFADIVGDMTAEQASLMSIPDVIGKCKAIFKENDITSFFTSVSASI